jgi:hypothetical protein
MNAYSGLAELFRSHTAILFKEKQPLRLLPRTAADELPPYREQLTVIDGGRRRALDPLAAFASDRPCGRAALYGL